MPADIHWNIVASVDKEMEAEKRQACNLLQSTGYILGQCRLNKQTYRRGEISIEGRKAGYFFILEASVINGLIHAVILDRGPIWYENFGTPEHTQAFFTAFNAEFPKRFGRRRRIIPEIEDTTHNRKALLASGLIRRPDAGYHTVIMNPSLDEETLRKSLKKNWRTALTKAEKCGEDLTVEWGYDAQYLALFNQYYRIDKSLKKYHGPAIKTLNTFLQTFGHQKDMLIGFARYQGEIVAGVLILCHGRGATYQVGWNLDKGRDICAHNLLLWDALHILRERKVTEFDLGGVNDETAAGIGGFKRGLAGKKGRELKLVGLYR